MTTLYAGPGKIYMAGKGLFPEGENGPIVATINQGKDDVSSGMFGRQASTQGDATASISITPFDHWGLLSPLFPPYIGAKVGATPAALQIGKRPHDGGDVPAKIWSPDGRLYTFPRVAVTKHPDLHLGVAKALYGAMELTAIGATGGRMGGAGFLYTITESGAADPGGPMSMDDFIRGEWTGSWGTVAGFGGDGGNAIEAEEEWVLSTNVKYSPLPVQRLTRGFKLDSVEFMAKCRPYGPTHTQIDAAIGLNSSRVLGGRFASTGVGADLVLTGPSSKIITLKNADVVGAGYEFGGTKLGTGEIGFVTGMTFAAGVAGSLIEFSA